MSEPLSNNVRAALWMLGTLASFSAMAVGGRELSDTWTPIQVTTFRAIGGMVIVLALLARSQDGFGQLRTRRFPMHFLRNSVHFGAQFCWFTAISLLPLATVFAVEFTIPMWSALLAVMFFSERFNRGRTAAIVMGFAGVLVIVQPGTELFNPLVFWVFTAAFGFAVSNMVTKTLAGTETTLAIIFYMNLVQMPLGGALSLPVWVAPEWADTLWIVMVSVAGLTAHYCLVRALRLADAIFVLPFDYLRLPLIAVVGFIFYDEVVGLALLIGAAMIVAGNFYAIRYETRLSRRAREPVPSTNL